MEEFSLKTIGEYRARYPQLRELTDYQLTRAVYDTTAPDMPLEDFAKAFGGVTEEDPEELKIQEYNLSHPDDPIRREDMGKASLLSDTGHGIAAGINELAAIPFWLAEEAGIESAGKAKDYFLKSAEEKRKGYSPEMKLAQTDEFFTEEPDGSYGLGGAWTSPRKILGSVAESAPGMVGGMGLSALAARGLMKAGFSRGLAWAVGSSLGEGTIGGAQNALDVHEAILAMPEDKLAASPEYQEILQRTGDPKRAREELANSVAAMTGLKTGASTAVLSAPSGYMFGKILGGETGKTLLGTAAKQGAAEFGEEAGQSGAEQYLSQAELQRADPTIDPMSGVGEAAVSGGFAGMAMGGGMGGFGHVLGGRAQQQPGAPAVSDAQPVLPPEQQAALPEGGHGSPLELGPGQNIVMGTDRAYEDPIATPLPTSPLQKGMEAILGGPLGLSTAPAAPDFAVTPGGRAVSANGIVQPDAFGPIAAGMRSDMPPLLADQVYDVDYSVVPDAPKALSEAPRGLPLGQDKSPVAPESPQPVAVQTDGESTPLQLTHINDKSFMLHGDTGPFEEAIKAAGGRLDRKVGGWRFPLAREGEIRELFSIPLGTETVPGNNLVSEASEASPDVLRETPLPVSGDMAMSGQTGLEVTHGGLQQGTTRTGTGELLSEPVRIDTTGNPGELDAVTGRPGDFPMGDRGSRPDMDTAVPGAGGTEAGLGAVVQRAAGPVEIPAEGVDASLLSPDRRNVPDGGAGRYAERGRAGRGFEGHGQMGRDVPGGSERAERAALEGNGTQGVEQKLLRAIERQNGELTPEAEAWARSLPPERQEAAWQQLTLDAFKGYTASNLRVDEASLKFIPLSKETNTSLQLKALANVFGQDLILFRDASKQPTGILGATVPAINNVIFMEENREGYRPHLSVLGHEMLHNLRNGAPRLYNEFKEYLLSEQKPDTLQRYREDLDRRTGHDGTVGRMSDDKILEEIGADLVGKRLTEESFWAKMAEERPSLFARVSQFVRDLLDRVTAAFRADPLPAAWVKDFDAIRRHIDAMMGQWAEKNARAKTGGTPPHSENTREVLDGRDETVRNAGRNGGEGSDHAGGLLQSNRGRHGAPVDLVGDGGRGGDGGRAAQPAPEGREGERPRQPVAVKIPNRADEPAHYELLEAEDVRASHLPSRGFQKNPAYGLENERRYHDEPGSRAKVMENAAKLDPAFLMESVDANHGAPVIDHDNNVLGGNGRAMSIARAYESFPERGEQYREALKANADRLGIDPAQVDAMHSPMLVRRLERGMSREERQRLVTVMNDDFKDAKAKRASGKSRGERFGRRTLDMLSVGLKDAESLREYFDTPASAAVVERMMEDGVIQRSERNAYVGADGLLNPDGKKVVEEALRGRVVRSYEALAKLPADVAGKLDAAIPYILVAEGIGKPWNITEHVRDSVDLLVGFKGSGVKEPDIYLKQVNMLTGRAPVQDFSKQAIALFRMALDAKKGEYVKAFESYLKNAKLSPEAGNIPGVAKPQDKAFRDAFGMKTEAMSNKPEKREAEKPQTEEETKGQPPEEEISSASKSKKEPQEQTSGKPGDAGHVERHRALYKSLLNGKVSLEDYHRGFSALLENEEAVRAELSGMTVNALLARGGAMFAWRHKGDKKADIVDALYRDMLSDFTLGQPYSVSGFMGMGPEEYRKATVASIRRIVDAQSEQTLADFARDAAAQREEYASRRKAEREAVENPKTLEDFRSFIRFHMDEGKTASEARDLLLFEQREQFDRLAAEASRSTRKTKAEPVLSSSSQTTGGEIIATKHTQKGHDLFVVRLEDRVSREDYLALLSSAKKLGGYYSKFRGNGAVPGFQFTGREQAEAFLKLAQGDKAEAQEAVKARRDAYKDDRSQTAVQRLNEMADRLDEDADASLNAARKVNTAKRAGQAAAADAMAYADKSLAKTMRNIAGAIGNGTATFLDRVREKKQVEQLRDALRMAKWEEDKTKYPAWDQREKHSEEPATTQTVEFAAFPLYRLYRSSWAELGRKLSEKDGTKSLGKKILSVADDVTETYLEFARSHLEEVSTYATQAGKPAVFKSREDAEKAIARSGYRGKAVVLPVKRGENRIILSPSAAQERGIWKGDDDRMLSLRPDLVDELFDKQGSTSRDIPWQLSDIRQKRKALARMGIETPAEYRMALREFVGLQAAAKQDKVRELERSVMRDAANNRGWLDFFPTPVAVTEEMLAAADIRPGMGVLEPSAGMGHIADRIREKGVEPVVAELEPQKRELLEAKGYEVVGKDFMKDVSEGKSYDRIVMNPPFSKRQDTEHVRRAYDLLKPGGRLVAIVSEGSFFGKDKKASEFRDWLEEVGGTSEKLAEGSFNDPALPVTTGVNTRMVIIEKAGTAKPLASLKEDAVRSSDATPVTVVEVEPGIVPEFKKVGELVKWLKNYFNDKRAERIESTQKVVLFSNTGLSASTKRVREPGNRDAYGKLNELVRKAVFERFEANDVRHPNLGGQEIYYSAMRLADKLYSVRLSLDVPSEAEVNTRRKLQSASEIEDLRFKGHELKEIEIAPITENYGFEGHTAIEAIRKVNLGVLRDAVKPSRLENGVLSSVKPGEFLNDAPSFGPRILRSAVQSVADALGKRAANAAETRVVQAFEELPEHIRQFYDDAASRVEGVYDPTTGTVYLVVDNLHSTARAAEVWMHENMVHHGLNGLLGKDEKRRVLNRLWQGMGGMGNAGIASIARKYGVDPRSDVEGRALVMEEYLAHLAEKRAADKLSGQEQALWRRFVEAVLRAWHALTDAVTGRTGSMKYENVDRLLSALDRYVFEGRPEGMAEGGMVPAMASVNQNIDLERTRVKVILVTPRFSGKKTWELIKGAVPKELKKQAGVYQNKDTGWNLTLTGNSIEHAIHSASSRGIGGSPHFEAVANLPDLLREAVLVETHRDRKDDGLRAVHRMFAAMRINDSLYAVKLTVKDYSGEKNITLDGVKKVYDLSLEKEIPAAILGAQPEQKGQVESLAAGNSEINLRTLIEGVNDSEGRLYASLRDVFGTTAKEEQRAEDAVPKTPLDSFRSKIGGHRPTVAERFAAFRENWKRKVEQQIFDHFASIKDVSKDGYVQARMTSSLGTQIESLIKYGAPVWNDGIMGVQGKSLTDVFAPVASEMDSFMGWMVANRAARLKKEGRENLFTDAEIAAARKLNEGVMPDGSRRADTYKKVFEDFARFKKAVLDFAQEGGIIDPESRSAWENADYIPFYRVKDGLDIVRAARNNSGLAGQASGIRTLKGGKANIGDPVENIMQNFIHLIDAAQKNRAADMILQDMAKARLARKLAPEEVARLEKRQGDELAEVLAQDKELAAQCGPLTDRQKKVIAATFSPTEFNYVRVQKDGKSLYYSVEDPMLLDALTGMWKQDGRKGPVWNLLRDARRFLTAGVTTMPDFMLRNFLRDTLHTWTIEHQSGYRPLVDSLAQIRNTFNVDEDTKQLLAAGSAFMGSGYRLGNSGEEAAKALNKVLGKYGMDKKAFLDSVLDTEGKLKSFIGKLWDTYEHAGSAAENAARLAVYKKMRAKGFSHREAAFAAKDLMDFTVRGQSQLIQSLCETVPFLGARLAGLHRLGRGAVENPRAFAVKGMTIALASMALYALNQALNPDDWDKMEDWEKDTYFHFWVDGEHFRLPKPFEVGFVFGTIPERLMEQLITDKSGGVFASRVFAGIWDQLAFNPFPQAVRPLVEQVANKDFFRGTPIVGMGMDRKAPVDQFDSRTSLTARAMASFMDALLTPVMGKTGADVLRSPKRLEHLVNGYFGGLGTFVLGASDMVLRPLGNEPEAPELKLEELPIIRSFYSGSGEKRTRYESELYEVMKQGNKLHASLKQVAEEGGDVSAAKAELSHDDIVALANRKGLTALTKEFGKLNKAAEKVRSNRVMSSSDKRRELDNIQRRKNILAQRAMKRIEEMRVQ